MGMTSWAIVSEKKANTIASEREHKTCIIRRLIFFKRIPDLFSERTAQKVANSEKPIQVFPIDFLALI